MDNSIKPIKRSDALIQFSREHHFGLLLVWKIRQGLTKDIAPSRISEYIIFFFENELTQHFKSEEKDLFSKLAADDPLRQQAFAEHEKIYSLINAIRVDKHNIDLLKEFADALSSHIRFEERVLFNHLQQYLTPDEQLVLEEQHNTREGNFDDKWDDHFWVIDK